jgi:hypothetical protein
MTPEQRISASAPGLGRSIRARLRVGGVEWPGESGSPARFWAVMNGGESAVLFCFIFLFFASRDSGVWSLDHLTWGNKARASGD